MPTPVAWSPAFNFNFRQADSQPHVRFVQLRNGDFWVVWTDTRDTGVGSTAGTDLVGQRYNAFGVAQGGEVRLNAGFFASDERNAHLAADVGSNEFFMVYEDRNADGSVDLIVERKNGDGTAIGGSLTIALDPTNDDSGVNLRNPRIAVASATNGLVVYERTTDAGGTEIVGRFFDPATNAVIGNTFVVAASGGTSQATDPQITVTSDGRYAIVWSFTFDAIAPNTRILGAYIDQAGVVDRMEVSSLFDGEMPRSDPSVAPLSNGRIVVTWTENDDIVGKVMINENTERNFVVTANARLEGDSRVVRLGDNSWAVAWEDRTLGLINVAAYDFPPGGSVTLSGSITPTLAASASDLALIALADGRVLLGYDNPNGTAQIFDPRAAINNPAVYTPDDMQIGTPGNDIFTAAANANIVHGWDGNDEITDGPGVEAQYFGGNGIDTIRFTFVEAAESADGGAGTDTLVYLSLAGPTTINLAAGTATTGGVTQSVINFESFFTDQPQDVTVTGAATSGTLRTGAGNDTLDGGNAGGPLIGGAGNDTYIVDNVADFLVEVANQGTDTVSTTLLTYTLPTNIENLTYTGGGAPTLRGNSANNAVTGGTGADLILLQDGGADTANGGGGNDGFYFGATYTGADSVNGGAGTLDQIGLQGNYSAGVTLGTLTGVEFIVLLPGNDARFGGATGTNLSYAINTVDANIAAGQVLTFQANTLRAGETFELNGAAETNGFLLTFGGLGNDFLTGGQLGDGFYFGTGRFNPTDSLNGQGGSDQLGLQGNFAGGNALTFGFGQLVSIEFIVLLSASDTRFGGGNAGQTFDYNLTMNDGNVAAGQQLTVQANSLLANENLSFNGAAETNGSFRMFGGTANDQLIGGQQADDINGNPGSDFIEGRGGADILRGGIGNDFFIYRSVGDSFAGSSDTIMDFASGDRIDLASVDANANVFGIQAFELIANGAPFTGAGQLRITQTGNTALIEGNFDANLAVDFAINVTVTDGHALGLADFIGVTDNQAADRHVFDQRGVRDSWLWQSRFDLGSDALIPPVSDLLI